MPRQPTITDIARRLGVSPTTVSDALNNRGRLSEATRERVRAAAAEIGYRPNAAARSLVEGRAGLLMISIGPVAEDLLQFWNVDFFLRVLRSASTTALRRHFALVVAPTNDPALLRRIPFDGAIIVDPSDSHPLVRLAEELKKPLVTIGRLGHGTAHTVDNDLAVATHELLDHLRSVGASRPALLGGPPEASYASDIHDAYESWCRAAGLTPHHLPIDGQPTEAAGHAATRAALNSATRPDAILAATERLALGASAEVREQGLVVPGDVMIAGFGDSQLTATAPTPLTMVELNPEALGEAAATALIAAVTQRAGARSSGADTSTVVPHQIVVRDSTAF